MIKKQKKTVIFMALIDILDIVSNLVLFAIIIFAAIHPSINSIFWGCINTLIRGSDISTLIKVKFIRY